MLSTDPSDRSDPSVVCDPYDRFLAAVVQRQITDWLPADPCRVLDLSRPFPDADGRLDSRIGDLVASAGHEVITVVHNECDLEADGQRRYPVVVSDPRSLDWVRAQCVDVVLAENGALSYSLATEDTLAGIARALRPGGRLLASAESLVMGLSRLAEQHRWPELADAPSADVMLVPDPEGAGGYTRCFAAEDLRELMDGAGLELEWIRPRTLLPATAVRHTLEADPDALWDLVDSELNLAAAHEGEAHGAHHVVSGIRLS